jgi:hypothetical protein
VEVTRSSPPLDPAGPVPTATTEEFPSGYLKVDVDKLPVWLTEGAVVMVGKANAVNVSG